MTANLHVIDRVVRVVLGLGLAALLAIGPVPGWGLVGLAGVVLLGTAAFSWCPIYAALGLSTLPREQEA